MEASTPREAMPKTKRISPGTRALDIPDIGQKLAKVVLRMPDRFSRLATWSLRNQALLWYSAAKHGQPFTESDTKDGWEQRGYFLADRTSYLYIIGAHGARKRVYTRKQVAPSNNPKQRKRGASYESLQPPSDLAWLNVLLSEADRQGYTVELNPTEEHEEDAVSVEDYPAIMAGRRGLIALFLRQHNAPLDTSTMAELAQIIADRVTDRRKARG